MDSVKISLRFNQIGLKDNCKVRDLWAKKDLGEFTGGISLFVRRHSAKLLKISKE
jgi:alpha-galactosidase